jgi:hypothetical protein
VLRKSRIRTPNLDDDGGDTIIDADTNCMVAGFRWDLDLDEVEAWATS